MEFNDAAIKFYLTLDEKQKWAIREFLRVNAGDNYIADDLLRIENYVTVRRDQLIALGLPVDREKYERFA